MGALASLRRNFNVSNSLEGIFMRLSNKIKQLQNANFIQMHSPVGQLTLIANKQALKYVLFEKDLKEDTVVTAIKTLTKDLKHKILSKTALQLSEYFKGKRHQFDLPLAAEGTAFQQQAWQALTQIPYGKTISYQQQAQNLGDKKKARAVGMANSANPISIIIPCHRVIGANGKLTGFGGGIDKKAYLLDLERKIFARIETEV